jgi:hypothetical protein
MIVIIDIPVDMAVNKFALERYQMRMFEDWLQADDQLIQL